MVYVFSAYCFMYNQIFQTWIYIQNHEKFTHFLDFWPTLWFDNQSRIFNCSSFRHCEPRSSIEQLHWMYFFSKVLCFLWRMYCNTCVYFICRWFKVLLQAFKYDRWYLEFHSVEKVYTDYTGGWHIQIFPIYTLKIAGDTDRIMEHNSKYVRFYKIWKPQKTTKQFY